MSYVIGNNTPGYLPDEMYDELYPDADSAKRALISEMLYHADHADMEECFALASELSNAAEDLNLTDCSGGYSVLVCDPDREHDLGTVYWIEIAEDAPKDNLSETYLYGDHANWAND